MSKAKREITIGHDTCLLGFSGRESVDSAVFDVSTLTPGGVNEVQTITINGVPTGGTFTLTYRGETTAAIAYNANAAAVQAALQALGQIGAGNVVVTGGPGPGTPYVVTFQNQLGKKDVDPITATASLTGGTTPSVTVAETTKGNSKNAGLYVIESGLILMETADGTKVQEYDASRPIVGIFDGRREFFGNSLDGNNPNIPVYNALCVFDVDKIKNYATYQAALATWGSARGCTFKSQGL